MAPCRGFMAALCEREERRLPLLWTYTEKRFTCRHRGGRCVEAQLGVVSDCDLMEFELLNF